MDKTQATYSRSSLTASGLNGKTITDVILTRHGAVNSVEIVFSGGSQFIKVKQGQFETGGTIEYGTGTILTVP